jgi:ATP-dependent DNA helicase PIF1
VSAGKEEKVKLEIARRAHGDGGLKVFNRFTKKGLLTLRLQKPTNLQILISKGAPAELRALAAVCGDYCASPPTKRSIKKRSFSQFRSGGRSPLTPLAGNRNTQSPASKRAKQHNSSSYSPPATPSLQARATRHLSPNSARLYAAHHNKMRSEQKQKHVAMVNKMRAALQQAEAEQRTALRFIFQGKSVFLTGSAGSGKSFVLHAAIATLPRKSTFVTSMTGVTAVQISGSTLQHWAGIGAGDADQKTLLRRVAKSREALARWRACKTLIIDEVSMLDGELFTKLDALARIIRKRPDKPFGGIQLVLVGDFFQLPPVCKAPQKFTFAFETTAWKQCIPEDQVIELQRVYRQKDNAFVKLLNEVRRGRCSEQTIMALQACNVPGLMDSKLRRDENGILPTCLLTRKTAVKTMNDKQLDSVRDFPLVFCCFVYLSLFLTLPLS